MLAYDYPLMGFFWSVLFFFVFFLWIMLLFRIFADIFRTHDMGGLAKTAWIIFVIVLPFLGVFVYLIARGGSMAQRQIEEAQAQKQQFDSYVRQTAGSSSADEVAKLAQLKAQGVLTDAEFAAQKARLLG